MTHSIMNAHSDAAIIAFDRNQIKTFTPRFYFILTYLLYHFYVASLVQVTKATTTLTCFSKRLITMTSPSCACFYFSSRLSGFQEAKSTSTSSHQDSPITTKANPQIPGIMQRSPQRRIMQSNKKHKTASGTQFKSNSRRTILQRMKLATSKFLVDVCDFYIFAPLSCNFLPGLSQLVKNRPKQPGMTKLPQRRQTQTPTSLTPNQTSNQKLTTPTSRDSRTTNQHTTEPNISIMPIIPCITRILSFYLYVK